MVKNVFVLLFMVLVLFTTFTLNEGIHNGDDLSTFEVNILPQQKISHLEVENYFGQNKSLRDEASKSIILTTLKNLGYDQWIPYADYITLKIYKVNIIGEEEEELIVGMNLSKDTAVIGVYKTANDEYIFENKIENLLPIKEVNFIKVPESSQNFLIIHQELDERFGAFFIEDFVEIFLYTDSAFKSLWKKTEYAKEIYNGSWVDPKAPVNEWFQIIEDNKITFNEGPNLSIDVSIYRQKLKAIKDIFPMDNDFFLLEDTQKKENYQWSPKYQTFIQEEGRMNNMASPVGIIEDTQNWTEFSLGLPSNNYKIITQDQQILYVKKHFITPIPR